MGQSVLGYYYQKLVTSDLSQSFLLPSDIFLVHSSRCNSNTIGSLFKKSKVAQWVKKKLRRYIKFTQLRIKSIFGRKQINH